MPHYLEHGARVSERWSAGRSAKSGVAIFHRKPTEDPDDRAENGAGRAAAEEPRWRFSTKRGGGGAADHDGRRCRGADRRWPARAHRRSATIAMAIASAA